MPSTWEHGGWGRPGLRFLPVGPPSPPCPQVSPGPRHSARGHRLGPSECGRKLAVLPAAPGQQQSPLTSALQPLCPLLLLWRLPGGAEPAGTWGL